MNRVLRVIYLPLFPLIHGEPVSSVTRHRVSYTKSEGEEGTSTFHLVTRFAYRITMIIACEISARDSVETSCLRTENVHRVVDQRKDKIN